MTTVLPRSAARIALLNLRGLVVSIRDDPDVERHLDLQYRAIALARASAGASGGRLSHRRPDRRASHCSR